MEDHISGAFDPILQALVRVQRRVAPRSSKVKKSKVGKAEKCFCTEGRLALEALRVRTRECGALDQPVIDEMARTLQGASTPALHGLREATLLDKRVRDTGELAPEMLELIWAEGALSALQDEVAKALGLHKLEARLHNLLVYGPGQFFKPHQDTEKQAGMVATLVLVWPSAHIGGELSVKHGEQQAVFASQHLRADALRWFAFYADCRHEVRPVSEGWRIVLTFDLVVPAEATPAREPAPPELLAAMRDQFDHDGIASADPWVFLLDHEYTEHGLRWPLLKGEDRSRVNALRAAAEELGLVVYLALAEIHEHWTATSSYDERYGKNANPEPDELLEDRMALDFWVDAQGRPVKKGSLTVSLEDAASFTDTGENFLVDEEYEGYMGNYGETLEYWYRRAALVIQTPQAAEASRFAIDFNAALADALRLASDHQGDALAQRLQAVKQWLDYQCGAQGRKLLLAYAKLGAALPDEVQAHALCAGFDWTQFEAEDALALAPLEHRRGAAWMQDLMRAWAQAVKRKTGHGWGFADAQNVMLWPRALAPFLNACRAAGLTIGFIECLQRECLQTLVVADAALENATPVWLQESQPWRLRRATELAVELAQTKDLAELLRHMQSQPRLYPLLHLRSLYEALPANAALTAEAQTLRSGSIQALHQMLARPQLNGDDQSLADVEWTCRCTDCASVIDWAESPNDKPLTLSMAQARRDHVEQALKKAFARFGFETIKRGSPHKLVISKPANMHRHRQAQRQAWADDLAALQGLP